jgi:hypothetical protein
MTPASLAHSLLAPLLLAGATGLMSGCGGGGGTTVTVGGITITVPGAPAVLGVSTGDRSASISFAAPASNGGSAVLSYSATCTAGSASVTATAVASPISLSGLVNGLAYSCSVSAVNLAGAGVAASVALTPVASTTTTTTTTATGTTTTGVSTLAGSTAGVQCGYSYSASNTSVSATAVSTAAWSCGSTTRSLTANGIPDHAVGTFPNVNNPNAITAQNVAAAYTLKPAVVNSSGVAAQIVGYVLNGVKMDPATAGSCDNSGSCSLIGGSGAWSIEALGQSSFNFGVDSNNAHVQPNGQYHYHGVPEGFVAKLGKGAAMTLIGWAADGFPVYARYGYSSAADAGSAIKVLKASWQLKSTPSAGRPSTTTYPMGAFQQDWQYVAGSGDLDECNGRTGVTPEFPLGTYHYVTTDTYPFIQRCLKGSTTP